MPAHLFSLGDLERAARMAASAAKGRTEPGTAARRAVASVAAAHDPHYSETEVEAMLERVYAQAQTDYRHQTCDPATRIAEALEELA